MKDGSIYKKIIRVFSHYFTFFILVAFVITCCTMLFVKILSYNSDIPLTNETIEDAAKLTFWNVVLISFIFAVIDSVRRKLTFERPAKRIAEATEKMIAGDFTVRVPQVSKLVTDESFASIIDCINKMAEELSGVETLRTDFIANVSHEMKTPLAVINNYGKLLGSETLTDEERKEYAKAITDATRRLSDMMTNILKLNRLENQKIYPKTEKFNLSEQLCECLIGYESVWEEKDIEIDTDIADDVFIYADSELLSLVWNNLFSNALKFTERGGKVTLTLSADEDFATVKVSDTGCGISSEVGAHMFEKFYQGDTSHASAGNGLGLALVRRVVDIMQGEIGVESTVGVGSTFTVRIGRSKNGAKVEEDR